MSVVSGHKKIPLTPSNPCSVILLSLLICHFPALHCAQVFLPIGMDLSHGEAVQENNLFSGSGNAAAFSVNRAYKPRFFALSPSAGVSLEYGNTDNIYKVVDNLSLLFTASDSDAIPSAMEYGSVLGGGHSESIKDSIKGILVGRIDIDKVQQKLPDLIETVERMEQKVKAGKAILELLGVDLYAKASAYADVPVLLGVDTSGGHWSMDINVSATSKIFALKDAIVFDADRVLQQFEEALIEGATPSEIYLTDGIVLHIDQENGDVTMALNNDSSLLSKVARIEELSLNYSRMIFNHRKGQLHLGIKPKYYRVGLSRVNIRIGDISDSEDVFDELRNAELREDSNGSVDVGLIWDAKHYYLGAALTNLTQPYFEFPRLNTQYYYNEDIIKLLSRSDSYTMEVQLKLSAGIFSNSKRWSFNLGLDANEIPDPMHDDFQWLTLGAAYNSNNWYFPAVRLGVRRNLAGSELTYLNGGITFLKVFNLDLATTLETVDVKGNEVPRGMALNLGANFSF